MVRVTNGVNIQTTNFNMLNPIGIPGQGYDFNPRDIVSKRNASAAVIPFGRFVARNNATSVKLIAADADVPAGLAMYAAEKEFAVTGETGWRENDTVPVARSGYFCMRAGEAVSEGDAVISITAQSGAAGSAVTGAAGAGRVAVTGAKWQTTTASGEVGVVYIDFHEQV